MTGEERLELLTQRKDFIDRYLTALFKDGRLAAIAERDLLRGTRADQLRQADESKFPVVLLRCGRRLPADAPLRLVWGQGIESQSGVPTSQEQVLEFQVRPGFNASFSCERVSRDANCLPFLPMQLSFSAPVARTAAEKMVLRAADGKAYKADAARPEARRRLRSGGDVQRSVSRAGDVQAGDTGRSAR